ncbi:MAG: histidine kinase, partial [Burkholderiales bacterium]
MELTGKLQDRIRSLQRSAERGASARMSGEQIRAEAPQLLKDVPEFRTLAWADPGLTVRWAVPTGSYPIGNELLSDPRRKSAAASAQDEGGPAITRPLEILAGQRGFEIYMPVYRKNEFHGLLIGVVMQAGWLESLLADRFAQYSIVLEEGGQLIGQVRLRERASGRKWRHRQDLGVLNAGWVLEVTPTQATVDAAATALPQVTLVMGIVLATLLAFTMFLFQVTLRRVRDAAEANRLLALDIDARKRAEQALRESEQELRTSRERMRSFSWYLQAAREEEKTRIARDLHDELGATLTALRMDSSWLSRRMTESDEAAAKKSRSVVQLADSAIQFIRRTITELRPSILDNLGLVAALRWQAKEFQERSGIVVTVDAVQDDAVVDKAQAVVFFRIFQEALTNVLKHAKARRVIVRFAATAEGHFLEVTDDGAGMGEGWALKETSHGILGMQERAGELNGDLVVTSAAGQGTTVKVMLPRTAPSVLAREVSR